MVNPIIVHTRLDGTQLLADYGQELEGGQLVMLPTCHPTELGAVLDGHYGWIIWLPVEPT